MDRLRRIKADGSRLNLMQVERCIDEPSQRPTKNDQAMSDVPHQLLNGLLGCLALA